MSLPHGRGVTIPDQGLVRLLLTDWRARCAARRTDWQLASGRAALALCEAVEETLELGTASISLHEAVRAWGAGVPSGPVARAMLQCLGEAAVELSASQFGEFRTRGLDPVLELLAREAAIPANRRGAAVRIDSLTRCPDRATLQTDLAYAVSTAVAMEHDLTVAVFEPNGGEVVARGWPGEDAELLALLATIRQTFGGPSTVYRAGLRSLAVVAPHVDPFTMGEAILLATCRPGPAFSWGRCDLRSAGAQAVQAPGLLLTLAEAECHQRRKDFTAAQGPAPRKRHLAVVGSAAAAAVLLAGTAAALVAVPGPPPAGRSAVASAPTSTSVPVRARAFAVPPAPTAAPPSVPPSAGSSPNTSSTVQSPPPSPMPASSQTAAVLTAYHPVAPAPTATPAPSSNPPAAAPPAAAPPAATPPPSTVDAVPSPAPPGPGKPGHAGNSANAPGHHKHATLTVDIAGVVTLTVGPVGEPAVVPLDD